MKYWVPAIGGTLIIGATMLLSGCDKIRGVAIEGANKVDDVALNLEKIVNRDENNAIASCVSAVRSAYPDRDPTVGSSHVSGYMKYEIRLAPKTIKSPPVVRQAGDRGSLLDQIPQYYQQYVICNTENGVVTALRLEPL